jgi:hypothetical protein
VTDYWTAKISRTDTEEEWAFDVPTNGPELLAKVIELLTELPASRPSERFGITVGAAIEIRRFETESVRIGESE